MTDHFARFDEPHRPWLEPEELKQKFLKLSGAVHPDHSHHLGAAEKQDAQEAYISLNAAYQCLREPKERLRHLLELERGTAAKEIQQIPAELMDVFMEIGQACREADAFLREKTSITSHLLKVQLFERGQEWTDKLGKLQARVRERRALLESELKSLDVEWMATVPGDRHTMLGRLENLGRLFSYFDRWLGQLQERLTQLLF